MGKKSYAEKISSAQVMLGGLNKHLNELTQRGMSQEFISKLMGNTEKAVTQNIEQEKLKADLRTATASLNNTVSQIDLAMSEATKVVKLAIPKEQWIEFGITAKR